MTTQIIYLILSFVLTAVLGKVIIPILKKLKVGQNERACGPRAHLKKQGTPTMGGIMMIITIIEIIIMIPPIVGVPCFFRCALGPHALSF